MIERARTLARSLLTRAMAPVESASLSAMRVAVGLLVSLGAARFLLYGWVEQFFVKPTFFFHYTGFAWVRVLPPWAMHLAFGALVVLGLLIAAGWRTRASLLVTFALFSYVELIDVTNYLNHYYLVSLLLLLLACLPSQGAWSLDARRRPESARRHIPAYMVWLLRGQVAAVYLHAGLAKAGTDWLIHAQPLNIWLNARSDLPLIGPWLGHWHVAWAMSWAGFLFDTTIVAFLLWPRSRPLAYMVVLGFHASVGALFQIGLFPLIMISAVPIFFDPGWPRRLMSRPKPPSPNTLDPRGALRPWPLRPAWRLGLALSALWLTLQLLLPLRGHLYPGQLLWHEQGMRWSWRVMVRQKIGDVTYRVLPSPEAREIYIPPSRYLTSHQEREMSGQPDLILQLGQRIGHELRAQGFPQVQVRVDALVSLNGRPVARLIDPTVDLMTVRDDLWPAAWILPLTDSLAPPRLTPAR